LKIDVGGVEEILEDIDGFIVEALELGSESSGNEQCMDFLEGGEDRFGSSIEQGFSKNCILLS
jgi:hypothetical protein